jgi:hypothetical protein
VALQQMSPTTSQSVRCAHGKAVMIETTIALTTTTRTSLAVKTLATSPVNGTELTRS